MSTANHQETNPTGNSSETVDEVKDELSQTVQAGADAAKEVAGSRYEQGRDATTDQLDSASEAISEAAAKLEENDSPFASYASELSGQLSSFSNKLSTSSIDNLVGGARSLARDNPAAFMLGSMAIGLAASRFFKATGEQVAQQPGGSGMSYDEHSRHASYANDQSDTRATTGRYDSYSGAESARARSIGASGSNNVNPPASRPATDSGYTDSTTKRETVSDQNDRINREEA